MFFFWRTKKIENAFNKKKLNNNLIFFNYFYLFFEDCFLKRDNCILELIGPKN